jgi:hypothetical protein
MKNLFEAETVAEAIQRIQSLTPASARHWGKMDVAQMVAHCVSTFDVATGQRHVKRGFLGYTICPLLKSIYTNEKPFSHNSPTHPTFIVADQRDLDRERIRLVQLVRQFHEGGPEKVTPEPHAFFGRLTPEQWARGMYKHLDHHLRQFGA